MGNPLFPAVVVNGFEISSDAIATEAQNHKAPKGKPGLAWRLAARALVIRELLLQEARKRDLQPQPIELEPGKIETDEEAMIREVLDLGVKPNAPTEENMKKVYAARPDMFRSPTLYEPAHILFSADPKDSDARQMAMTKAQAVIETLKKSPRDFGQLARELSNCPSKNMDGQLGQLMSGDTVPEFEAAMDRLAAGETCYDPVETRYGVHVVRMNAKAEGEVLPFEKVRDQISEMLEKAEWVAAADRFVNDLVAGAEISGIDMTIAA